MSAGRFTLELYRGDAYERTFVLRDGKRNSLSLDGASIQLIVKPEDKKDDNDDDTALVFLMDASQPGGADSQIKVLVPEKRSALIQFAPIITKTLEPGTYPYQIRVKIAGAAGFKTVLRDTITVHPTLFQV